MFKNDNLNMKDPRTKCLIVLICVLLCTLNSYPNREKDTAADLETKPEYDVVVMDTRDNDLIGRMAVSYIKRHFNEVGIEIKRQPTNASIPNYALTVDGREKGDKFEMTVFYGVVLPPPTGTMPDNLEKVSMDIAKGFQKFIELMEDERYSEN